MHQFPILPISACTEIFPICGYINFVVTGTGIAYTRQECTKRIQCVYAIDSFIACISGNKEKA